MCATEISFEELCDRMMSKAAFFTDDEQVLSDLKIVIETLRSNITQSFYDSGGLNSEEIEAVYFEYINSNLLSHVEDNWLRLPMWQRGFFFLTYKRVSNRMKKVRFLAAAILAVDQTKAILTEG
ncbi:hypothetical protein [Bdellovibrio bacteriovorus]|uniref:hypothetical protein n=1 Tax=Bdellovibrio bacteriovorus TaxID=959 RepID=UPI0035A6224A